jgi:hypothetical protein
MPNLHAFPQSSLLEGPFGGMTLREYYAGQALGAIITATSRGQHTVLRDDGLSAIQSIARDAVEMADALLAALANAEAP